MNTKERIMIVDDEKIVRESLYHWFMDEGYKVDTAENAEVALKKFDKDRFDLILLDMKMPGMSGLDLLPKLKQIDDDCFVILITAYASVPSAIQALKEGAFDYITKPVDPEELNHIVKNALQQKKLKTENEQLKSKIDELIMPDNLIGESIQMKKIFELINTVAKADTTVLIRGESGTGKELVAKAIHLNSKRKYFPIVTVNCGAMPDTLLETELFGHEKGAFTGAHYRRKGKFEMANDGTILLDEVGSISAKMQVDLLRVIETKKFSRIGGNEIIESDFRVIAATNEQLENLVKEGKFREDLYYRLNVFTLFVPPLRERKEDIPILANFFRQKYATMMNKNIKSISAEAMNFLTEHEWRGNVRELENAIERAIVVGKKEVITMEDLPFNPMQDDLSAAADKSLNANEKKYVFKILKENNWNISRSAEILEIDRVTLYNKINKYGLKKD
jgi:DNA-binding NtrC family response regulator